MKADALRTAAQQAIERQGPDALIALVIPGSQTRQTRRRLWKGGPMAECIEQRDRHLVVQMRARDLLSELRTQLVVEVNVEVPEGWQPE